MNKHVMKGKWIDAGTDAENRVAPIFKKTLKIEKEIKKAEIYICGLGLFELKINGFLPDNSVLNPAHTQYDKTVLYRVFDISHLLTCGENTVTVELGNGFFNENNGVWNWQKASWRAAPKLIADICIDYADSHAETVSTDESWIVSLDGPTVTNSIYLGETYDARKKAELFTWQNAKISSPPAGTLKMQEMPPIRKLREFKPVDIKRISEKSIIVTAPEMITGWAAIRINEPKGTEITVTYCEQLDKNGFAVIAGKGEGKDGNWWPNGYIQQDKFISSGEEFVFEPKFSYKGFRYIQIDNCLSLKEEDVTLYRTANDIKPISDFTCSDENINRLHSLMRRTLYNNFQGKPTDTPVFEKNGWLGDANCALETMMLNFDMNKYLESFTDTMADCFELYGNVPVMVPAANWGTENSPVWNTIFVFAAEALINYNGRTDYAEKLYPLLRKFALNDIDAVKDNGYVWGYKGLADWVAPMGRDDIEINPCSSEGAEICGTAFIYSMLLSIGRIAEILGKKDDSKEYIAASEKIKKAFNQNFYRSEKGIYETNFWDQMGIRTRYRQTSNLLPLAFGMADPENKAKIARNLANDIVSKDYHLDTGCMGTRFVLPVLFDCGYADIAFKVLTQKTYPSWGFWLENGADSAWECWESSTRSMNHYFLATYDEALYTHIAGIKNIRNGFSWLTLEPELECGLEWAKAEFYLKGGKLRSKWKKQEKGFVFEADIPNGVTAKILLGKNKTEFIKTSGKYIFRIDLNGNVIEK